MGARAVIRAAVRDEWDGLERITRDLRPADFVTSLNALAGIGVMLAAVEGHLRPAFGLLLVGVILDGLDGLVSRAGGGGGPLGGTLDSLADTVTFVAAPAVVVATSLAFGGGAGTAAAVLGAAGFYVLAGLLRLARFESLRETKPRRYFSGLSSPGAALTLVAVLFIGAPTPVVLATAALLGLLMVTRLRYPKLRGALGALAGLVILLVLATWSVPDWQRLAVWLMLGFMGLYVVAGPFYVLLRIGPMPDPRGAA